MSTTNRAKRQSKKKERDRKRQRLALTKQRANIARVNNDVNTSIELLAMDVYKIHNDTLSLSNMLTILSDKVDKTSGEQKTEALDKFKQSVLNGKEHIGEFTKVFKRISILMGRVIDTKGNYELKISALLNISAIMQQLHIEYSKCVESLKPLIGCLTETAELNTEAINNMNTIEYDTPDFSHIYTSVSDLENYTPTPLVPESENTDTMEDLCDVIETVSDGLDEIDRQLNEANDASADTTEACDAAPEEECTESVQDSTASKTNDSNVD